MLKAPVSHLLAGDSGIHSDRERVGRPGSDYQLGVGGDQLRFDGALRTHRSPSPWISPGKV